MAVGGMDAPANTGPETASAAAAAVTTKTAARTSATTTDAHAPRGPETLSGALFQSAF